MRGMHGARTMYACTCMYLCEYTIRCLVQSCYSLAACFTPVAWEQDLRTIVCVSIKNVHVKLLL